jgi:hypothetical protein
LAEEAVLVEYGSVSGVSTQLKKHELPGVSERVSLFADVAVMLTVTEVLLTLPSLTVNVPT